MKGTTLLIGTKNRKIGHVSA